MAFFPIDTIKTRLQAKNGFRANGGWRGIYRGLGSCVIASAPSAALFFVTYESIKQKGREKNWSPVPNQMLAASCGEVAACAIRVPAEVVKQRTQASVLSGSSKPTSWSNFLYLIKNKSGEGVFKGLYRGWNPTILREIPFTIIQFPLYEWMKVYWRTSMSGNNWSPLDGALCGCLAGGIAAAATTPLDVIKTRIMLSQIRVSTFSLVRQVLHEEGIRAFFSGLVPRTSWISAGGAIFLGCYDNIHTLLYLF